MDQWDISKSAAALAECDVGERAAAARGELTPSLQEKAQDWLRGYGYDLPTDSPEFRSFALKFARMGQQGSNVIKRREAGEFVDTPPAPPATPNAATTSAPLLSEVIDYFLSNYDKTKPMYRKHTAVLPLLLQSIGDRPVDTLKQMEIEDFAKLVCRLPPRWTDEVRRRKITVKELAAQQHPKTIAPKTFEDTYIASVRPFLSTARRILATEDSPAT
jgi:hypothetical protein